MSFEERQAQSKSISLAAGREAESRRKSSIGSDIGKKPVAEFSGSPFQSAVGNKENKLFSGVGQGVASWGSHDAYSWSARRL